MPSGQRPLLPTRSFSRSATWSAKPSARSRSTSSSLRSREEAAILEELFRKQDQIGDLTEDQVADVVRIVGAREDELEVMERIAEVQGFYLDATRSVRGEIEAILAGQGKLSNLKQVFQRLQGGRCSPSSCSAMCSVTSTSG